MLSFCIACGNNAENAENKEATPEPEVTENKMDLSKEELQARIDELTQFLMTQRTIVPNQKEAFDIISYYKVYADKFRDDSLSVGYLYKAGEVSTAITQHNQAIHFFERVAKDYPDSPKAPEATFLVAFTYHEHLKDIDRARESYERVIAMYPDHHWAQQAKGLLSTLDMSEEELIRQFEEKNKSAESWLSNHYSFCRNTVFRYHLNEVNAWLHGKL